MKYLFALATAVLIVVPVAAQHVTREYRFASGRVTEFGPASPSQAPGFVPVVYTVPAAVNNNGDRNANKNTPPQDQRNATNAGHADFAAAIRALNPSYAIAPAIGPGAIVGGSYYIRTAAAPASPATAGNHQVITQLLLPPPSFIGGWGNHVFPSWAYSGTIRVDAPRVAANNALEAEVKALRDEVNKLRKEIEAINSRINKDK